MTHAFLALAALALLVVIGLQDYLVPSLRNATISSGLTGRYHVLLDVAYVPLAASMFTSFGGHLVMQILAAIAGLALVGVAATNTAWRFFDRVTDGQHSLWHSRLTITVFASALLLQVAGDHGHRWLLTLLNLALPAAAYVYFATEKTDIEGIVIAASPAAEKLYVAGLCVWLFAWSLPDF